MSSLWRVVKKLLKHPLGLPGFLILATLYTVMIFAEFVAPYSFDSESRLHSYAPPTSIRFRRECGEFSLRPFFYNQTYSFDPFFRRVYEDDHSKIFYISLIVPSDPYRLWGLIPMRHRLFGSRDPDGRFYLAGADFLGRDILSRIIYGSRVSLTVGLIGVFISALLGLFIGGVAGYFGGVVDAALMRLCELILLFPSFFLLLVLRYLFPVDMSSTGVYMVIITIMSLIGWAGLARVIRGMTSSIREQEFVQASEAFGQRRWRIIMKHLAPQTASYLVVALTLAIPSYILSESGLSIIGLGIVEPYASWGNMLSAAMNISVVQQYPWLLLPGFLIFLTVMGFNFLGDGLRDILDPKSGR